MSLYNYHMQEYLQKLAAVAVQEDMDNLRKVAAPAVIRNVVGRIKSLAKNKTFRRTVGAGGATTAAYATGGLEDVMRIGRRLLRADQHVECEETTQQEAK